MEIEFKDLNAGTGDPCAGHDKLRCLPCSRLNVKVFDSTENLGPEPPIGSATKPTSGFSFNHCLLFKIHKNTKKCPVHGFFFK